MNAEIFEATRETLSELVRDHISQFGDITRDLPSSAAKGPNVQQVQTLRGGGSEARDIASALASIGTSFVNEDVLNHVAPHNTDKNGQVLG